MDVSVGLVSATCFRVPSAGVVDTFGPGSFRLPWGAGRGGALSSTPSAAKDYATHLTSAVSADKGARASAILQQEDALTSLHRTPFAAAQRPTVAAADPLDTDAIRRRRSDLAREGVRWFELQSRRKAMRSASEQADHEIGEATAATEAWVTNEERRIETWWAGLGANDPAIVSEYVAAVFREAETPATPMEVRGGLLDVALLIPGDHALPAYSVHLVSGQLSIRRASRAHRARMQRRMVAGLVIAVARQALAAGPGLTSVRVHAIDAAHRGRYDDLTLVAIAELGRQDLAGADLDGDAEELLQRYAAGLRWVTHSDEGSLRPLVLEDSPALADLLAQMCRSPAAAPDLSTHGARAPA